MARALFTTGLIGLALLGGCATTSSTTGCPRGQERLQTAELFFGRNIGGRPGVSDEDFRRFTDEELTPRFPQGLTVLDGGGQWKGAEDQLIREAAKVVVLVLPKGRDPAPDLEAVRKAYIKRFRQESVMMVTRHACVAF